MANRLLLTPEMTRQICAAVEAGNNTKVAAELCDITYDCIYNWCKRGEAGEKPYQEFLRALTRARAIAEDRAVKAIVGAFDDDWKAAEAFLKRARHKDWGDKQEVTAVNAEPAVDIDRLSNAELVQYLELRIKAATSDVDKAELQGHLELAKRLTA